MADQVEVLKRLQALDGEIFQLRNLQQEKPRELAQLEAAVAAEAARLKVGEDRLKALQVSQKDKEVELAVREGKVKKLQGQLFQVKTNREYTAMQHEIDSLRADNSVLEEAVLKLFDEIDRASEACTTQRAQLASAQERLRTERQRIERELGEIGDRVAQLARDRETVTPEVPGSALAAYEQVLESRDGLALVPVIRESCGGCDRRLPPQIINEVYLKARLVTCENCNRILYFDASRTKL